MKGIKNFIHNSNDIALAILIVIVAAGLIIWRLNVILAYPEQIASQSSQTTAEVGSSASTIETGEAFENGVLKENVNVTIGDGGTETAVAALIDENLFADYEQFTAALEDQGVDSGDVQSGAYSFNEGMTVEDVIATLTTAD